MGMQFGVCSWGVQLGCAVEGCRASFPGYPNTVDKSVVEEYVNRFFLYGRK